MLEIGKNALLAPDVYEMTLVGDASAITAPGQFINIRLDGLYLRRPISVCDWGEGWIRVIYKVVGKGTEQMSRMGAGEQLDVLAGLGNGFDVQKCGEHTLVIGGGVGVPPLYGLTKALTAAGKTPRMAGTDISKAILRSAARRARGVEWAVASSFHLPVADGTADILLDCFSPLALEEFRRVLKPGGRFLYVVPGPDHLWELKQVLYDRPYPNEEKETPYEGFAYRSIVPVEDTITLPCQADIHALFQMTPYYWKTPKAGAARLAALDTLTARISFRIHIFQKS